MARSFNMYDQVNYSELNLPSFQEMMWAPMMMTEQQNLLEQQAYEQLSQAQLAEQFANETPGGPTNRNYNAYMDSLNAAVDTLSTRGYRGAGTRQAINQSRANFNSMIAPIFSAAEQRKLDDQSMADLRARGMIVEDDPQSRTIDAYLANNGRSRAFQSASPEDIYKTSASVAQNIRNVLSRASGWVSTLGGQYFENLLSTGASYDELAATIANDPSAPTELRNVFNQVSSMYNIDRFTGNNREQLIGAINSGLYSALGSQNIERVQNQDYINALQRLKLGNANLKEPDKNPVAPRTSINYEDSPEGKITRNLKSKFEDNREKYFGTMLQTNPMVAYETNKEISNIIKEGLKQGKESSREYRDSQGNPFTNPTPGIGIQTGPNRFQFFAREIIQQYPELAQYVNTPGGTSLQAERVVNAYEKLLRDQAVAEGRLTNDLISDKEYKFLSEYGINNTMSAAQVSNGLSDIDSTTLKGNTEWKFNTSNDARTLTRELTSLMRDEKARNGRRVRDVIVELDPKTLIPKTDSRDLSSKVRIPKIQKAIKEMGATDYLEWSMIPKIKGLVVTLPDGSKYAIDPESLNANYDTVFNASLPKESPEDPGSIWEALEYERLTRNSEGYDVLFEDIYKTLLNQITHSEFPVYTGTTSKSPYGTGIDYNDYDLNNE